MTHENRTIALLIFLHTVAQAHGVGEHTYVVGGAVRNYLMGHPIKDLDVVIDSVTAGRTSEWFAEQIQRAIPTRTNLTTNQYGVAILTVAGPWILGGHDLDGEIIEVANARKESYGGAAGKGYKPHMVAPATIQEDLLRRDFTFNTLLWRLGDLRSGPEHAQVLDLTGQGLTDLAKRVIRTPAAPDTTFSDDPTRMLRAIKFMAKYGFTLSREVEQSILANGEKLKEMPWDAVRKILTDDVLTAAGVRISVARMRVLGLARVLKLMLHEEPGFATALSRSLADQPPQLILDMLELEWPIRGLLSTLSATERAKLKEILEGLTPSLQQTFWGAFQKPLTNQERLFDLFAIPPKERQEVNRIARSILLASPEASLDPRGLEASVEAALRRRYRAE